MKRFLIAAMLAVGSLLFTACGTSVQQMPNGNFACYSQGHQVNCQP